MSTPLALSILGSTGSIGTQALEVARWRGHQIVGLAAGRNLDLLVEQALEFRPRVVSVHPSLCSAARDALPGIPVTDDPCEVAVEPADVVLGAIPGLAGLEPTRAALEAGRNVALANKEAMVVAGPLMWAAARSTGARIAPVDSEHCAVYQCLVGERPADVAELVLTASGGPFLDRPDDLASVTPQMALRHPRWNMGPKVTVDSSTLMNKGLEVIEASFLFDLPVDRVSVIVHPQSIVHSMVRFRDGQLKAQLGRTDMRLAIGYGIDAALDPVPARPPNPLEPLALTGTLEFREPDRQRFPCLDLAIQAGLAGGVAPVALNAADEVAVDAFLAGRLSFTGIPHLIERVLEAVSPAELSWASIRETDELARAVAREAVGREVA